MPVDPVVKPSAADRRRSKELRVAAEIAHAFLTAERPHEVYRIALERVAPLVGAAFACVFLREADTDLLRIVAAYNWPQRYSNYLDMMRVRPGNGPTGRSVVRNELVDVENLFADPELEDWWESARELGFTSAVALPLAFASHPVGALTFYFRDTDAFRAADRNLLRLVAGQLAATAEKAHLIEDLEAANARLSEQNVVLEQRFREAEEAKRLKSEFVANISHEIRTPLTTMLGYAFLLKEQAGELLRPDQVAAIERIEVAGGQLVSLVEGLLDLTRLKLGSLEPAAELCDAVALARTTVQITGEPPEGVAFREELPDRPIRVHTDPNLVVRVLRSLLSNAWKFTPSGVVTLTVLNHAPGAEEEGADRGGTVVWEVRDTGIGIAPEEREAIFEEFRQADGSATRRFGGAGLGLAVARGVAHTLGGEIEVESTPGQGSCFRFRLPALVVQAGPP